jgi:hypothetical protein
MCLTLRATFGRAKRLPAVSSFLLCGQKKRTKDHFVWNKMGRTKCARRGRARDGADQRPPEDLPATRAPCAPHPLRGSFDGPSLARERRAASLWRPALGSEAFCGDGRKDATLDIADAGRCGRLPHRAYRQPGRVRPLRALTAKDCGARRNRRGRGAGFEFRWILQDGSCFLAL